MIGFVYYKWLRDPVGTLPKASLTGRKGPSVVLLDMLVTSYNSAGCLLSSDELL